MPLGRMRSWPKGVRIIKLDRPAERSLYNETGRPSEPAQTLSVFLLEPPALRPQIGQNASQFDFTMEEVWAAFLKIKEDELVAVGDA